MQRAKNQVVLVTGSTKGIGRSIAIEVAKEGGIVVVHGQNEDDGLAVVKEIEAMSARATFIKADITKPDECKFLINETVKHFSRIDVLVNNAGITARSDFLKTDEALFDQVMTTNFKGAYFLSQFAIEHMLKQGGGNIVNIISTNCSVGQSDLSVFTCSQAAMRTLSKQSARFYIKQNIRCNSIIAGWVTTPGLINSFSNDSTDFEELEKKAREDIPLGNVQTGEDIAAGVLFFIDPESRFVSGTEIDISGGVGIK